MKKILVRYKVFPDQAKENEEYIRAVFDQLSAEAPDGIRYASFKLEDGVSFVHIASVETSDGSNPLPELSAFKNFVGDIKTRCEEPPVAQELTEIGNYNLF